jgi:hypothetical protein
MKIDIMKNRSAKKDMVLRNCIRNSIKELDHVISNLIILCRNFEDLPRSEVLKQLLFLEGLNNNLKNINKEMK